MAWSRGSGFVWSVTAALLLVVLVAAPGCDDGNASAEDGGTQNTMVSDAGGGGGDGASGDAGAPPATLTLDAVNNSIVLERCAGLMPATVIGLTPGTHSIGLTASNLSKGSVSGPNDSQLPSFDDYVIVHVPLAIGAATDRRFFMLNGVGTMTDFTMSTGGEVHFMFVDSDAAFNSGSSTVTIDGTGPNATVDGIANVLAWSTGCSSTPATLTVSNHRHRATLADSTMSAGDGSREDFVLLRLPSEQPRDPSRFVILNGVGASIDFTPFESDSLRAWYITPEIGASGQATVVVTDL
jgi:hypothetical protein